MDTARLQRRFGRRAFLRWAASGTVTAALAPTLAACDALTPSVVKAPDDWWAKQRVEGVLDFANWPYYIDRTRTNAHPSLELFTSRTGIAVNYYRPIRANATFLEEIRPDLEAGRSSGYDLIVITNGPELSTLISNGWLTPLDHSRLPNFVAHASPLVQSPSWDPGNRYTVAWQSGLTGLAFRPEAARALGRPPTSIQDLWSPALVGRVGMFADLLDLGSFGLLAIGRAPELSRSYMWQEAAARLREQRDAGIVRGYYDQSYVQALERGEIWVSQAWSGDIFQANALGHPELRFVLPEEGAMFWTDSLMIPKGAEHPLDASTYMDFVYDPYVAALIADWVWYISPVPDAKLIVADRLGDPTVANSPLVFPPEELLEGRELPRPAPRDRSGPLLAGSDLNNYYRFIDEREQEEWRKTFSSVVAGG